jgi:tripartite-type tricarboxylate transporter receptor subunit TctC
MGSAAGPSLAMLPARAFAQSGAWPAKPIRIICAQGTGSSNDTTARILAEFITSKIGAAVIVENKPGAVGTIAGDTVVRAPADGYTLLFTLHSQLAQAPVLLKKVPYDPNTDLVPIGAYGTGSAPVVVRQDLPVKTMQELVEHARKNPVSVGNYGIGSSWQIMVTQLVKDTGAQLNLVNYKGTGAMVLDLMAGNIDVGAGSMAGLAGGIHSGKLRPIHLVGGSPDNKILPPLLTWEQAGFRGDAYTATRESNMLLAPKGTPREVVDKLAALIDASVIESERMKELMAQLGQTEKPWTGQRLADLIQQVWPAYRRLTQQLNLQIG